MGRPQDIPDPDKNAYGKNGILNKKYVTTLVRRVNRKRKVIMPPGVTAKYIETEDDIALDLTGMALGTLTISIIANGAATPVIFNAKLA